MIPMGGFSISHNKMDSLSYADIRHNMMTTFLSDKDNNFHRGVGGGIADGSVSGCARFAKK